MSHPNCSRFTCPAVGLPSPLTHLWRPPAIAGAGGHAQVDSGTPYRGRGQAQGAAGQAPSSPDQAEQRRPAHRPSAAVATSPSVVGPACTPAATHSGPEAPATAKAFCEALRCAIIPTLPGYTDAPWEITTTSTPAHTTY